MAHAKGVREAVDKYGENAVAECIRHSLADGISHRAAGAVSGNYVGVSTLASQPARILENSSANEP